MSTFFVIKFGDSVNDDTFAWKYYVMHNTLGC